MKKVLVTISALIVGNIMFFLAGYVSNLISPTPEELMNPETPEVVALRVSSTPTFKWISTIVGYLAGLWVAFFITKKTLKELCKSVIFAVSLVYGLWIYYTFYIVYPYVLWVPTTMLVSTLLLLYLTLNNSERS